MYARIKCLPQAQTQRYRNLAIVSESSALVRCGDEGYVHLTKSRWPRACNTYINLVSNLVPFPRLFPLS